MKNITCFGDSITLGQIGAPFVDYIEGNVENLGINGLTTASQLEIVESYFDGDENADAYVLAIGSNDMIGPFLMEAGDTGWKKYYESGDGSNQTYLSNPDDFAAEYRKILDILKKTGKPIVLACPPHLQLKGFDENIEIAFDDRIKALGKEYGFPVVDTKKLQHEYFGDTKYYKTNEARKKYMAGIMLTLLAEVPIEDTILPKLLSLYLTVDGIHSSAATASLEGKAINTLING